MCLNPNQYAASGNCFVFFVVVFSPPSTAQEKKKDGDFFWNNASL